VNLVTMLKFPPCRIVIYVFRLAGKLYYCKSNWVRFL